MRIVFEYTGGDVLSLYSLEDFYSTAKRMCEDAFTVTTPEESIQIRTPDMEQTGINLHIVVQLIGENDVQYEGATLKWISIGKGYNWDFVGVIEDKSDIPDQINAPLPLASPETTQSSLMRSVLEVVEYTLRVLS